MQTLFMGISKYLLMITMVFFVLFSFIIMRDRNKNSHRAALRLQSLMIYVFHLTAFMVIYYHTESTKIIVFYVLQLVMFLFFRKMYLVLFDDRYNKGLMNNMCLLLCLSFVMLTRLNYSMAVKQFYIVCGSVFFSFFVTWIIKRYPKIARLTYFYCFVGIAFLGGVLILGQTTRGAKLSITIKGFTFQPSEFVKILFVFFLAAFLKKEPDFKHILISAIFAGIHVLILVFSTDLGSALIFFIVYFVMIYVASGKVRYFYAGLAGGVLASILSYHLFAHVRTRVLAFQNPWAVIDGAGYQVSQSLFAIGTGGFLGLGLYKGSPKSIPLVEQDFMFSAIVEEMGGFFGICLIFLCLSCYLYFIKSALKQKQMFYKLVGLGLSVSYAVQTILTIGGAIKFIPSTGVTLPLLSYGGSSVLCTMVVFAILQGLFVISAEEENRIREEAKRAEEELALAVTQGLAIGEELYSKKVDNRSKKKESLFTRETEEDFYGEED